jgi:glycosyltransferase involved in cell wall biosynthesis
VASTVGIFPQIVGKDRSDLLVAPGDPAALAERLAWWLLHGEVAMECGQELRRRVKEHFGSSKSIAAYERVLLGLAGNGRDLAYALI